MNKLLLLLPALLLNGDVLSNLPDATPSKRGIMTAADKTKLDTYPGGGLAMPSNNSVTLGTLTPSLQNTVTSLDVTVTNFDNCAPTTDGSIDCLAGFQDAIASLGSPGSQPRAGSVIVPQPTVDGAYYFLSAPLHITRTMRLHGAGGTGSNQYTSRPKLVFPAGSNGIVVDYADGATKNGIGAEIDHLSITSAGYAPEWLPNHSYTAGTTVIPRNRVGYVFVSGSGTHTSGSTEPVWNTTIGATTSDGGVTWTTTVAAGVQLYGLASIHDNSIFGFSGNGMHIECSVSASNCNQWKARDNFVQANAGSGLFTSGSDSNAAIAEANVFDSNDAYGINEASALGSEYSGNEVSDNGIVFASLGFVGMGKWHALTAYGTGTRILPTVRDGKVFINNGSVGTSGATEPSWDTTIGHTTVDAGITWTCFSLYTGGSVHFGGYADVNSSIGNGNYTEGGEYPVQVGLGTRWESGASGAGVDPNSTGWSATGPHSSMEYFQPVGDQSGIQLAQSPNVAAVLDTDFSTSTGNSYYLHFSNSSDLTNNWMWLGQNSTTFAAIGMTTANSQRSGVSGGPVTADDGVLIARNGAYWGGGAQRLYSTPDSPGNVGYFGDMSFRDYANAGTQDGAISYVNVNVNNGTRSWARGIEYLQGIQAKTSTYQLKTEDSKQEFSNFGTGSEVTFNLVHYGDDGSANYGWWADFLVEDSHGMQIHADYASSVIFFGSSVTATNGYIESTTVGSSVRIEFVRFLDPGMNTIGAYYVKAHEGTWSVH